MDGLGEASGCSGGCGVGQLILVVEDGQVGTADSDRLRAYNRRRTQRRGTEKGHTSNNGGGQRRVGKVSGRFDE